MKPTSALAGEIQHLLKRFEPVGFEGGKKSADRLCGPEAMNHGVSSALVMRYNLLPHPAAEALPSNDV